MKRAVMAFLITLVFLNLLGCSSKKKLPEADQSEEKVKYTDALEVWDIVLEAYDEEDLFAICGGNQENAVMDAPGKFDISKTEELTNTLGLPESQFENIDDAASMMHLMNANTFTGAVYHLKDGADINTFSDEVKESILAKHWLCGQPDTLLIVDAGGGYVITAYGYGEFIQVLKNNALSALSGSQVVIEAPVL